MRVDNVVADLLRLRVLPLLGLHLLTLCVAEQVVQLRGQAVASQGHTTLRDRLALGQVGGRDRHAVVRTRVRIRDGILQALLGEDGRVVLALLAVGEGVRVHQVVAKIGDRRLVRRAQRAGELRTVLPADRVPNEVQLGGGAVDRDALQVATIVTVG